MSFVNNLLKVFVGDKTKKDLKSILPLVDAIKEHETAFERLSLDDLREKQLPLRKKLKPLEQALMKKFNSLKQRLIQQKISINVNNSTIRSINSKKKPLK